MGVSLKCNDISIPFNPAEGVARHQEALANQIFISYDYFIINIMENLCYIRLWFVMRMEGFLH